MFYIALYPVRWTALFLLWQTCSFRHQLDFSGKQTLRRNEEWLLEITEMRMLLKKREKAINKIKRPGNGKHHIESEVSQVAMEWTQREDGW